MRPLLSSLVIATTLAMAGTATSQSLDFSGMSEEERAAFRDEVRSYLLENPEVIFEAIQILEQRRELASRQADRDLIAAHSEAIFNDGFSYVGGNVDGDVTVVEFLDYRCGYCKRAHPEVQEMLDRDPNIRLVVKEFPILGPDSVAAGKMALAALEADASRYKELGDALMTYPGNLTEEAAYRIAGDLGYDIAELKERAGSTEVDDLINRNYQLAQALGIQGTPAFVIGSEILRGYLPVNDMMKVVESARAQN